MCVAVLLLQLQYYKRAHSDVGRKHSLPSHFARSATEMESSFGGARLTGCFGSKFFGSGTKLDILL